MERTSKITQITIPVEAAPGQTAMPGSNQAFVQGAMIQSLTSAGVVITSQYSTMPMVLSDFTPELLAQINLNLADIGLVLSKI